MRATARRLAPILALFGPLVATSVSADECPQGPPDGSEAGHVELVRFRFEDAVDEAARREAIAASVVFLCARRGFLGRWLLADDDGLIDVVLWTDRSAALAALQASEGDVALAPFLEAMRADSIELREMIPLQVLR